MVASFSDAKLGQQSRQRQVYLIIHGDIGQRSDQLQGGTAGADRTVHDGGRARGGSSLAMKEAVFFSNMMLELGFDESLGSVPLYINNASALHVAGNRTYSPRAKHIALRYFFRARTDGRGQGKHPLRRQERGSAGRLGHLAPQQAPSSNPHQAHQRV